MAISDDFSYVRTAQILAQTGHIAYNGWGAPVLGWQLYPAAAFIRMFGFSFSVTRFPTILMGVVAAFLMQRIFVRSGTSERNATIGTLTVALSPLFLLLSATFMTDAGGFFAIVLCLYGCLRAMQAASDRTAIAWIWFAVVSNAITGTSRQIAWLGLLVMVPCLLWLLRERRRVVLWGALATLVGCAFIAVVLAWFGKQPYVLPEHLFVPISGWADIRLSLSHLSREIFDLPILILAIFIAFATQIARAGRKTQAFLSVCILGWGLLAFRAARHGALQAMLEPLTNDWAGPRFFFNWFANDQAPEFLSTPIRFVLTLLSLAGLLGVIALLARLRVANPLQPLAQTTAGPALTRIQLAVLLVPFALATLGLMIPRSVSVLYDRYLLSLMLVVAIVLVRLYQDFVKPSLPLVSVMTLAAVSLYAVAATHDVFSLYRARIELSKELQSAGVPADQLDGGYDYNGWIELTESGHINAPTLLIPANSYVKVDLKRGWTCPSDRHKELDWFPHFQPRLGIAFHPEACQGPAPYAPVTYSRWLALGRGSIYAVKYRPWTSADD